MTKNKIEKNAYKVADQLLRIEKYVEQLGLISMQEFVADPKSELGMPIMATAMDIAAKICSSPFKKDLFTVAWRAIGISYLFYYEQIARAQKKAESAEVEKEIEGIEAEIERANDSDKKKTKKKKLEETEDSE